LEIVTRVPEGERRGRRDDTNVGYWVRDDHLGKKDEGRRVRERKSVGGEGRMTGEFERIRNLGIGSICKSNTVSNRGIVD